MTSRDTTGILPKPAYDRIVGTRGRSALEWATLIGFGAIQWPWLLRSLHGGRKADKNALLDRLQLPRDALPNLGSWKADTGLLTLIADHILAHRPKVVVEFGTGASTLIIARALEMTGGGTFISFEQHPEFVNATRDWLAEHGLTADLRAVRLRPSPGGWPGLWYNHGELPNGIDLMVIDGPPWSIHPFTRGAAETLFGRMSPTGVIMLDDAARPGERVVARRWRRQWPEFRFTLLQTGTKGTLIGQRRG